MSEPSPIEILVATRNIGKVREISDALSSLPVRLRHLDEFPMVTEVEETGTTYAANAALKALRYSEQTGLYALADDSGLEVDALGGIPGIFSNRFAGNGASDQERIDKLLHLLSQKQDNNRSARFVCSMVFARWLQATSHQQSPETRVLHVSEGRCEGRIGTIGVGTNGFGFDPVFIPDGYDKSFGELDDQTKAVISHRAKALAKMREFLVSFLR